MLALACLMGAAGAAPAPAVARAAPASGPAPAVARAAPASGPARAVPAIGPAPAQSDTAPQDPAALLSPDDASASAPVSSGDPLTRNGFDSPLCRDPNLEHQLGALAQANCGTARFVASGAPTGNYAFDVHIDTGALGFGNLASVEVQDLLLTPAWTAVVWIVHALVLALEWCYALDLFDGATLGSVTGALSGAQRAFTQPWMAAVLSVASVLALYRGVVRRRVADTLGEFVLMLAMMVVGLWVILDPAATVGSLSRWAQQSSLGTLGAISTGTPDHAAQSLAGGMGDLFATAIGDPWCYLEFGDVDWCRDPKRLDPHLHAVAEQIAAAGHAPAPSAALLRSARTNGDLFLALPANGPERNSINDPGSLLRALCGTSDATRCRGPTAEQAQFRTASGTWPRAGGLLLICIGAAGMIALLAFIALRLLGAAVGSLLYLLLAPAAVLAPALGDGGRRVFTGWGTRLLGAVLAKLMYSVFLGVVLLVLRILDGLGTLGWWTQWILVAVLWWTAFGHRHEVLRLATMGHRETGVRGMRVASTLMVTRELGRLARGARRLARAPDHDHLPDWKPPVEPSPPPPPDPAGDGQLVRTLVQHGRGTETLAKRAPAARARLETARPRLDRLRAEQRAARANGDGRRSASLGVRIDRVEREVAGDEALVRRSRLGKRAGGGPNAEWLDAQARLPSSRELAHGRPRRDYAALAGLAGLNRGDYQALDAQRRRAVRLTIDRELDQRWGAVQARAAAPFPRRTGAPRPSRPRPGPPTARPESPVLRRERQFAGWRAASRGTATRDRPRRPPPAPGLDE
jgi:hypothetical protein